MGRSPDWPKSRDLSQAVWVSGPCCSHVLSTVITDVYAARSEGALESLFSSRPMSLPPLQRPPLLRSG